MAGQPRTRSVTRIAAPLLLIGLSICGATLLFAGNAAAYSFDPSVVTVAGAPDGQVNPTSPCSSTNSNACVAYDYDFRNPDETIGPKINSCDGQMWPDMPVHAFYDGQTPPASRCCWASQETTTA